MITDDGKSAQRQRRLMVPPPRAAGARLRGARGRTCAPILVASLVVMCLLAAAGALTGGQAPVETRARGESFYMPAFAPEKELCFCPFLRRLTVP